MWDVLGKAVAVERVGEGGRGRALGGGAGSPKPLRLTQRVRQGMACGWLRLHTSGWGQC